MGGVVHDAAAGGSRADADERDRLGGAVGAVAQGVGARASIEGEGGGAIEEVEGIGSSVASHGADACLFGFNAQGDGVGAGGQLQDLNAGDVGEGPIRHRASC